MSTSGTRRRRAGPPAPAGAPAERESAGARQTRALGARLAGLLPAGAVVGLSGPLGAGKTVFVQGLAEGLRVPREARVTSPTFVLLRIYPGRTLRLYHFDAYRLSGPAELVDLGALEIFGAPGGVSAVEWADRVAGALPAERLDLSIEITGEATRLLTLAARGASAPLAGIVRRWGAEA